MRPETLRSKAEPPSGTSSTRCAAGGPGKPPRHAAVSCRPRGLHGRSPPRAGEGQSGADAPRPPQPPSSGRRTRAAPSVLYNGMIAPPRSPTPSAGATWYQGERNCAAAPTSISTLLPDADRRTARRAWGQGTSPSSSSSSPRSRRSSTDAAREPLGQFPRGAAPDQPGGPQDRHGRHHRRGRRGRHPSQAEAAGRDRLARRPGRLPMASGRLGPALPRPRTCKGIASRSPSPTPAEACHAGAAPSGTSRSAASTASSCSPRPRSWASTASRPQRPGRARRPSATAGRTLPSATSGTGRPPRHPFRTDSFPGLTQPKP